jgi:hypothetical protein
MARLRQFEFSTDTLGEKKANVKRQVAFALRSLPYRGTSGNDIQTNERQVSAQLAMMDYE